MNEVTKLCKEEPNSIVAIEADGSYSTILTQDGSKLFSSYCKSMLMSKFGLDLKAVNRKVSVNKNQAKINKEKTGVQVASKTYLFSRSKRHIWINTIVLIFSFIVSFAQNNAPIALNDTLKVCNDTPTSFSVFGNDSDPDGDRIILSGFNNTSANQLVALGNTGSFRFNTNGNVGVFDFQYTIKDLKFANIGSKTASATVFISTSSPYIYSGTYTTTNTRTACRSSTSGPVVISNGAREKITVDTYGELLPGTVISPDGTGVFELTAKK